MVRTEKPKSELQNTSKMSKHFYRMCQTPFFTHWCLWRQQTYDWKGCRSAYRFVHTNQGGETKPQMHVLYFASFYCHHIANTNVSGEEVIWLDHPDWPICPSSVWEKQFGPPCWQGLEFEWPKLFQLPLTTWSQQLCSTREHKTCWWGQACLNTCFSAEEKYRLQWILNVPCFGLTTNSYSIKRM